VDVFVLDEVPGQRQRHRASVTSPGTKPDAPVRALSAPARRATGAGAPSAAKRTTAVEDEAWETF